MQAECYTRKIHVYETDLMGIVHHSNYLRFCEEARVDWFQKNKVNQVLTTEDVFSLVVVSTRVQHKIPIRFGDPVEIQMQLKAEGPRLVIQYKLQNKDKLFALAETVHCRIDMNFKVLRLAPQIIQRLEKEKWIETWL